MMRATSVGSVRSGIMAPAAMVASSAGGIAAR
jgi:hypothetical protein